MPSLKALAVSVLIGLISGCVVAQPEPVVAEAPPPAVVIGVPPPAPVVEVVPAPRPGFIWVQGYWRWNGSRHAWEKGRWEPARVGYHYVQPHWENHGGQWHFTAGIWMRG